MFCVYTRRSLPSLWSSASHRWNFVGAAFKDSDVSLAMKRQNWLRFCYQEELDFATKNQARVLLTWRESTWNRSLSAFEMLMPPSPLNDRMPAASEIPAPVPVGLGHHWCICYTAFLPQTTTILDDVRTDCLMACAMLSISGSKGIVVLSIMGAGCWCIMYELARNSNQCLGLFVPD